MTELSLISCFKSPLPSSSADVSFLEDAFAGYFGSFLFVLVCCTSNLKYRTDPGVSRPVNPS